MITYLKQIKQIINVYLRDCLCEMYSINIKNKACT